MNHLVADIGGTNARFRLSDGTGFSGEKWSIETARFARGEELLVAACEGLDITQADLHTVVVAVAGPVEAGFVELTNTNLVFDEKSCSTELGCAVHVINDFHALAMGVPHFAALERFGDGQAKHATKVVLGPGSGLGVAALSPEGRGWRVISGEGGHADLAPGNHLESELWNVLTAKFGHVSWETVLCGPGLWNLYEAMCATWGSPAEELSAEQISDRGQDMSDLVCHQTLEVFAGLLGAAAGNLALTMGAKGGVYLAGGIVPRMVEFLQSSSLRRRFEEKGLMSGYVQEIPLYAVLDEDPGLIGAQACLRPRLQ